MYVNYVYAWYPKKSEKDTGRPETELQIVVSPRCGAQTTKPGSSTRTASVFLIVINHSSSFLFSPCLYLKVNFKVYVCVSLHCEPV